IKLRDLGYGEGALHIAESPSEAVADRLTGHTELESVPAKLGVTRIASEYPNLSESFALNLRLRRFSIFPIWGAAEVYPPENADLVLVSGRIDEEKFNHNLVAVGKVLIFGAYLIANKNSCESKDLSQILTSIDCQLPTAEKSSPSVGAVVTSHIVSQEPPVKFTEDTVRLALPDGHQQSPTLEVLNKAGIRVDDYPSATGNRRPNVSLDKVMIKVVRPQDMPLQVANGNFDLAITGRDWLREHFYQFPCSPVTELLDLKFGKVKLVAVISKDLPVNDINGLNQLFSKRSLPIRVASEYVNIADKYAGDNRLGAYRVIPTWGATEAFLPEDADLLIENTQTGRTIARHNLKIIDTLFESTACLIGNMDNRPGTTKGKRITSIIKKLQAAVEDN
ncbi:MAG: ATP phosphoribosyltransferase, partial [Dehalococcoidales bacterium]|nr:ATP phosphoribosyltransferase [Dehalococcoidales bacterium]